jgi:hypothetical protein
MPRIRNSSLRAIALISAAAASAGCGLFHSGPPKSAGYQKEVDAVQQAGMPTSARDLAQPQPSDDENAATVYVDLKASLDAAPLAGDDELIDTYLTIVNPTQAQTNRAKSVLARRADMMERVHKAASRPKCVFDRDYSIENTASIKFPELKTVRAAARMLSSESLVMARSGQALAAVQNEARGFTIARHGGSDRALVSFLVQCAIDLITTHTLQKIMVISGGDPRVAAAVRQAITANWKAPEIAPVLATETAFQISLIDYLGKKGPEGLKELSGNKSGDLSVFGETGSDAWNSAVNDAGEHDLNVLASMRSACDLPYSLAFDREKSIAASISSGSAEPDQIISAILLPDISHLVSSKAADTAAARITRAAASLLEYKGTHGAPPARIDVAVTPPAIDPFSDRPLGYRREGSGFVVYSVGQTGQFRGGRRGSAIAKKEQAFRI